MRAVPGLKVFNLGGKTVAQAVASQETEHISRFVRMQKTSKKKTRTVKDFLQLISSSHD